MAMNISDFFFERQEILIVESKSRKGRVVPTRVVLVDAIDANAKRFYEKYGFVALDDLPLTLVLPIETIAAALRRAGE